MRTYRFKQLFALLVCLAALRPHGTAFSSAARQAGDAARPAVVFKADDEIPPEIRRATFVLVWETIRDKYFDPSFGGKDWNAIRSRYESLLEESKTSRDFHSLLGQMLKELGRSHLGIAAPHQLPGGTKANPVIEMVPDGIALCLGEGRIMLASVRPDSPAWAAGLRPGYVLVKAGDAALPTAEEIRTSALRAVAAALQALAGQPSSTAVLTVLDENDKERSVTLPRDVPFQARANLVKTKFEHRRVHPRVGYIRFDGWGFDLVPKLQAAMKDLWDSDGFILDCRQNRGGVNPGVDYLAAVLSAEPGLLAVEISREGERREWSHKGSGADTYRGRLAILVDGGSGSASEAFAGAMQEKGRAVILGQTSVGGVLNSTQVSLPTGGILNYAHSDMKTPKGNSIEGRGVIPDVPVEISRADLLKGKDSVIERAMAEILKSSLS